MRGRKRRVGRSERRKWRSECKTREFTAVRGA